MTGIMNFLRNLLYKFGIGSPPEEPRNEAPASHYQPEPRFGKIDGEAIFATKDGYLVVVLDHQFSDVPSWMEWDAERKIVSITHLGGDMDEVHADIKDEYVYALIDAKRVLLASNQNDKKVVHFVPFLTRKKLA